MEQLIETQIPSLRLCVTSRQEPDIKDVPDPLGFRSVSLHDESGQNASGYMTQQFRHTANDTK